MNAGQEDLEPERWAAKTALRAQNELLQTTLASIGDAVITTDAARRVTFMNPEAQRLTGWPSTEALGQNLDRVFRIVNEQTRQKVACPVENVLETGRVVGLANHTILVAADGTERPIDDSAAPIQDESGNLYGVVLVFRDITERHEAARQLRQAHEALERQVAERTAELSRERSFLAAVLEAVEDGIVACDANGVLTLFNRATRTLHGLPHEPIPAHEWAQHYDLYRADGVTPLPTEEIPLFRALSGERVQGAEMVVAPKQGAPRTLIASGQPLLGEAGRKVGAVVSMHDVTAQRQAEKNREAAIREQARRHEQEAVAEQLRQSNERFALLLESAGEGIYGMELDGCCTFLNTAGAAMLGYRPEELIGRHLHEVVHHHRADGSAYPLAECKINQAVRTGVSVRVDDEVFWRKDGTPVPVSYSVSPMLVDGKPAGAVITYSDITQQRQSQQRLQASEQRVRVATEAAQLGLWMWDPAEDRVTWENDRLYEMLGLPRSSEPINAARFASEFVHPADVEAFKQAVAKTLETGARFYFEGRFYRRPDGELRWLEFTGLLQPATRSSSLRVLGTAADITERKRTEQALRDADMRKDEFLAMLAHELRNPLAPLTNAHHLIERTQAFTDAGRAALAMAQRQTRQLHRLVDDLLEISRVSRGKIDLKCEPMMVATAVYHAAESVAAAIAARGQTLRVAVPEEPVQIVADPARIAQVLENLLANASKYTAEGGAIRVEVEIRPQEVEIRVIDNGIGIEPGKIANLFELFSQIDATLDRSQGGLGIGLALVKRLVELHGGGVAAASPGKGNGATFTVRLPRPEPSN